MLIQCNVTVQAADESIFWKIAEILSPVLLFGAGYLLNWVIQNKKDKKHEKQMIEIVNEWLKEIDGHCQSNMKEMNRMIDLISDSYDIKSIRFVTINTDRLLTISDADLRLAIKDNNDYVQIISTCYGVNKTHEPFRESYIRFMKQRNEIVGRGEKPSEKQLSFWSREIKSHFNNLLLLSDAIDSHFAKHKVDYRRIELIDSYKELESIENF
jgi:hypothetical protein